MTLVPNNLPPQASIIKNYIPMFWNWGFFFFLGSPQWLRSWGCGCQAGGGYYEPPSQGHWQRAGGSLTCTLLGLNPGPFLIEVPGSQNGLYQRDFYSEIFITINWNYWRLCDSENSQITKTGDSWIFEKKIQNQNLFAK
jgi:hypothetical protein